VIGLDWIVFLFSVGLEGLKISLLPLLFDYSHLEIPQLIPAARCPMTVNFCCPSDS